MRRLTDLLRDDLEKANNAGVPFSPEQIVCLSLDILGGGHFQRTQGALSGSSQASVHNLLYKYYLKDLSLDFDLNL